MDRRFASREWQDLPYFAFLRDGYLLTSEYLNELAALAPLPPADKHRLAFATRQVVDALSPANFPATNPDVLKRALATEGASLARGAANLVADARKGRITMADEDAFEVGRNLALTPGDVVFRNELIELIQYAPSTGRVHRRPLLIVPPCINKYYILDLQPSNSFVRHAVAAGHTVFLVSWRNIPPELGHVSWDDYLEQGVLAALGVVREVSGSRTVNTLGFCVGGTLLASALAVLAAQHDRSVESATFLTTMLDFEDPGEIGVYISKDLLEARRSALMSGQRVHGSELAGAFASLRANDLVWNYVVGNYLKGETPPAFDLLYWNGDSANLPGPMYAYYLENLYLANRLARARCADDGRRARRPRADHDARVRAGDARRPHRALAQRLPDHRARRRRRDLRPRRVGPHRGGDQPARGEEAQLLDQRAAHRRRRRLVRPRAVAAGKLVAALDAVARAARRTAAAGAPAYGQRRVPAARAGARVLRARACLTAAFRATIAARGHGRGAGGPAPTTRRIEREPRPGRRPGARRQVRNRVETVTGAPRTRQDRSAQAPGRPPLQEGGTSCQ